MSDELLKYFDGDEFAASTWENKYAKRTENGDLLEQTPDDMHRRLAKEFARIEDSYVETKVNGNSDCYSKYYRHRERLSEENIFNLFKGFKYIIPAGSVMAGLGNEKPVSLSNCFVLPSPEDSYGSIMMTRLNQAELMKRRGGVGYDLSNLRPRGASVNNAAITSTGAASFMDVCSDVTNEVAQQGRRGALMLSLNINHPDILEFIEKKQDLTKVTGANVSVQVTDEFMQAVENDETYLLKWPVDACINEELTEKANGISIWEQEYGKLYKMVYGNSAFDSHAHVGYMKKVRAKDIWDKAMYCAWNTAEPGIIFKGQMDNFSPDGVYAKYKGVSTNPCVTGDTKVAVADGRGYVSFKQLAEEGNDVDVYCLDDNGQLTISRMINPRISGYNEDIYEVTMENGHVLKCTGNHKILTNDKGYVEAKNLQESDSLMLLTKSQQTWDEMLKTKKGKHQPYYFLSVSGSNKNESEHRMIYKHNNPDDNMFEVVHHKDFNGLNNSLSNLQGMKSAEHILYHRQRMLGDTNPMVQIKNNEQRLKIYSQRMSERTMGEQNGNCKITIADYKQTAIEFAKLLKRNFYLKEWLDYCQTINYPKIWDKFLQRSFGDFGGFTKEIASEAHVPYITARGKLMQKYLRAISNGYENVYIDDNETDVFIERKCEYCGKTFIKPWDMREHSFCSISCCNKWQAKNSTKYQEGMKRVGIKNASVYLERNKKLIEFYLSHQIDDFAKLKRDFRDKTGIIYDSRAKFAYKSMEQLQSCAANFNHKVVSVKYIGKDTVYNGTVEKYHNYFTGEFKETNEFGRDKIISINQKNCGEIYMSGTESCRLIAINLLSFVDNPFTKDAKINIDRTYAVTYEAMRLGDDLVDLENEAVSRIIEHVKNDKYSVDIWKQILDKGRQGRRVGIEFTALSDMVAALNKKFCTEEGNALVDKVCHIMMSAILDCQSDLALERGVFPDYDPKVEGTDANEWYKYVYENYPYRMENMLKNGRRNISFTTAGPTGSLSILTRTSSGIEPVFMPFYVRRRKCMTDSDRVDYVDKMGIKFSEFVVVHPQLKTWAKLNIDGFNDNVEYSQEEWKNIYEKSPWFGACAQDIDWRRRVELQSIVQHTLITHSISSTVNLPNNVTVKEVSDIYMEAWKRGLKGITVYRDGSREGIMLKKEKKKEDDKFESYVSAPKRPKTLNADFYTTKVKGELFYVMVGLYKEKPYEIFVYRTNSEDPVNVKNHKGTITKVKKNVYQYESEFLKIDNISMRLTTEELATVLYSSMLMRTGANLKYIIKTAQKVDDNIASFTAAMTRILKKYLKDEIIEGEVCPDCGGKLIRENGCIHCIDCGWSRCD